MELPAWAMQGGGLVEKREVEAGGWPRTSAQG